MPFARGELRHIFGSPPRRKHNLGARGERGVWIFPSLGSISRFSISVPIAATRLLYSLRIRGNMVRELDGRELRSMMAVALINEFCTFWIQLRNLPLLG